MAKRNRRNKVGMRQKVCVRSIMTNREATEEWAQREGEPEESIR